MCSTRRPAPTGRAARPTMAATTSPALPTFTIDPDTARDFDDAISVAREGDGYRSARAHRRRLRTSCDQAGASEPSTRARRRTSSVYLPLFAEPMLPAALSSDLCSLAPRQPRKCLTVEFAFAPTARARGPVLSLAISSDHGSRTGSSTRSSRRRTVRQARRWPASRPAEGTAPAAGTRPAAAACLARAASAADEEPAGQSRRVAELAEVLRRRRIARGALDPGLLRARVRLRRRPATHRRGACARRRRRTPSSRSSCWPPTRRWPSCLLRRAGADDVPRARTARRPASVRELLARAR